MFDPEATEQDDLREGRPPWRSDGPPGRFQPLERNLSCDIVVVGAGISGALMAEHLSLLGYDVVILDRERPGLGSTVASTAMLLWEIDKRLGFLTERFGFERAANIYTHSLKSVAGLAALVEARGLSCAFHPRPSLYLAADEVGPSTLMNEHRLRERAGLPGRFLDHRTLLGNFGIDREAALVSPGSAEADPLRLAHGLLAVALGRGAKLFNAEAVRYESLGARAGVVLDNGREIEADAVVLTTGYVMPDIVTSSLHSIGASWALATPPQPPGRLWAERALIWEASENYLYARATADGRVIVGGEDEDGMTESKARAALAGAKAQALLSRLAALYPAADTRAEMVWSGAFGQTEDGLPLIGEVPGHKHIFAAYGYGGNGITFSFMASRIIARLITGDRKPWYDDIAIDRSPP